MCSVPQEHQAHRLVVDPPPQRPLQPRWHAAVFHADTRKNLAELQARGGLPALPDFEVRLLSDDIEAVRAGALAGLGLAPLSAWMVAEELARRTLVRVLPGLPVPPARAVAVFPPARPLPARIAALLERLHQSISAELARIDASLC